MIKGVHWHILTETNKQNSSKIKIIKEEDFLWKKQKTRKLLSKLENNSLIFASKLFDRLW